MQTEKKTNRLKASINKKINWEPTAAAGSRLLFYKIVRDIYSHSFIPVSIFYLINEKTVITASSEYPDYD